MRAEFYLAYSLLFTQHLEQCLTWSSCPIPVCGVNTHSESIIPMFRINGKFLSLANQLLSLTQPVPQTTLTDLYL